MPYSQEIRFPEKASQRPFILAGWVPEQSSMRCPVTPTPGTGRFDDMSANSSVIESKGRLYTVRSRDGETNHFGQHGKAPPRCRTRRMEFYRAPLRALSIIEEAEGKPYGDSRGNWTGSHRQNHCGN